MKRRLTFTALCLACVAAVSAYPGIGKLSMDQTAIVAIFEKYATSQIAFDVEGFMSLWDVDEVKMSHGMPTIVGKADHYAKVKKSFDAARGKFDRKMEVNLEEIVVSGDYAFVRGTYTAASTPKSGGAATLTDGKFITVLRRQPDGSWLIYRDIPTSNVPAK